MGFRNIAPTPFAREPPRTGAVQRLSCKGVRAARSPVRLRADPTKSRQTCDRSVGPGGFIGRISWRGREDRTLTTFEGCKTSPLRTGESLDLMGMTFTFRLTGKDPGGE